MTRTIDVTSRNMIRASSNINSDGMVTITGNINIIVIVKMHTIVYVTMHIDIANNN